MEEKKIDNRKPLVIDDFMKKVTETESIEGFNHLAFIDWIEKKEHLSTDWIIIGKKFENKSVEDSFTISCLAKPANDITKSYLFGNDLWRIIHRLGQPQVYGSSSVDWVFDENSECNIGDITLKSFVFRKCDRKYNNYKFDVIQNFVMYYNAYWIEDKSEYQTINDNGNSVTIIKHIIISDNDETIYVNTEYLRDYLALTKSFLIRFHDLRRMFKNPMPFVESNDNSYFDDTCFYDIHIYNDSYIPDCLSYSRLNGKDIIKPFLKPILGALFDDLQDKYIDFIYRVDDKGNKIEHSCNEDLLSSYFKDTGNPHHLTPIFFKRMVLKKYYDEPIRFSVESNQVSCLSFWNITIDQNSEGLIQVWLGDLGRIPYHEQQHWKLFNVPPSGKITQHRFETDFEAKFSLPSIEEAPIVYLKNAYSVINSIFKKEYSEILFLDLDIRDKHCWNTLRLPLNEEWKEFDEQIQYLAKIFCDSINIKFLNKINNQEIAPEIKDKKNAMLNETLIKLGFSEEILANAIQPLYIIQDLRSSGSAHRKGQNFEKNLRKYELDKLSNEMKVKLIIINLYNGLQSIIDFLEIKFKSTEPDLPQTEIDTND